MHLVKLRASQLNGCAYCLDMHWKDLRAAGDTEQRLYSLDAWRECPYYTPRERAALAWTEAVTFVAAGQVPDSVYEQVRVHFDERALADSDPGGGDHQRVESPLDCRTAGTRHLPAGAGRVSEDMSAPPLSHDRLAATRRTAFADHSRARPGGATAPPDPRRRSDVMTISRVSGATVVAVAMLLTATAPPLHGQAAPAAASPAQPAAPAAPSPPARPATLTVPAGFSVSVFASGLQGARLMAVSPEGTLIVAKRAEVVALPDANHDGVAEPQVLLSGMTYAHSLAFKDGYLYIGTTPAVMRAKWAQGGLAGPLEKFVDLPSSTPAMHTSRSIAFGPDGRLYVGIGSSCNVCVEGDPRRTTIQVFDAAGGAGRTFAAGLHNPVGFDWDPATGRMWTADTGQEQLGDDMPPDEINLLEEGKHYGFPFYYGPNIASAVPELKDAPRTLAAGDVIAPALDLPAHASPLGITFYRGSQFPAPYRELDVRRHSRLVGAVVEDRLLGGAGGHERRPSRGQRGFRHRLARRRRRVGTWPAPHPGSGAPLRVREPRENRWREDAPATPAERRDSGTKHVRPRHAFKCDAQHVMNRARRARLLHVVEDQHGALRHAPKNFFEIAPRKNFQAGQVFGREMGQRLFVTRRHRPNGKSEIVKERRDIGVARVDLIPHAGSSTRIEPTCSERRLARPRRRLHPNRRGLDRRIEQLEQPRPRMHRRQSRPRDLRWQRRRRCTIRRT